MPLFIDSFAFALIFNAPTLVFSPRLATLSLGSTFTGFVGRVTFLTGPFIIIIVSFVISFYCAISLGVKLLLLPLCLYHCQKLIELFVRLASL